MNEEDIKSSMNDFCNSLKLNEMIDNRAGDLSGGQKRKLCVALSLLGNPPFVVMDEPTAGVDVQSRQTIWKTIASLRNTTTLITSHALEEAESVSSRMFIVSRGKLVFSGTSTSLRKQYKCGYMLKIDQEEPNLSEILTFVQSFISDASLCEERADAIRIPVNGLIGKFLNEFDTQVEMFKVRNYSLSVEQIEDMLIKMIQTDEAQFESQIPV
jgi:ABC-type multidrug transport system ATPase subunit